MSVKTVRKTTRKRPAKKAAKKAAKSTIRYAKTTEELAKALEVTRRTITEYLKLPGCPGKEKSGYDLGKWIAWAKSVDMNRGKLDTERQGAKTQKEQAQAAYWEFRVARERGDYVLRSEMEEQWATRIGKAINLLRAKFENELPPLLEGLSPVEIQAANQQALDEVIEALHRG